MCERIANADEIEVTPEMIEAGVRELSYCESGDSWESIAISVYLAMNAINRSTPETT